MSQDDQQPMNNPRALGPRDGYGARHPVATQKTAPGDDTHGAADPGMSGLDTASAGMVRMVDSMVDDSVGRMTAMRDSLDDCIRQAQARGRRVIDEIDSLRLDLSSANDAQEIMMEHLAVLTRRFGEPKPRPTVTAFATRGQR